MKKKILKSLCLLLCLPTLFCIFVSAGNAETTNNHFLPGDINGDSRINSADARLSLRASARLDTLDEAQKLAADVNMDGNVNSTDARTILRVAAKLEQLQINVELEVGQKYVVDELYDKGSYCWQCTIEPGSGLALEKTIEELQDNSQLGSTPKQTYTFKAVASGTYSVCFRYVAVGTQQLRYEVIYNITVK